MAINGHRSFSRAVVCFRGFEPSVWVHRNPDWMDKELVLASAKVSGRDMPKEGRTEVLKFGVPKKGSGGFKRRFFALVALGIGLWQQRNMVEADFFGM